MNASKEHSVTDTVTVALLAIPNTSASVLYCLHDVLVSVGDMWTLVTGQQTDVGRFTVSIVSPESQNLRCFGSVRVQPDRFLNENDDYDLIIIPDIVMEPGFEPGPEWATAADWLLKMNDKGTVITTVCTGSVLLAATGLLNGKPCTSHWSTAKVISSRFPEVTVLADRILLPADEEHRLVTSGGSASWEELVLYLIKRYFGYEEAARICKLYLLSDRGDGQLPFTPMIPPRDHEDAVIGECQQWIADHYADENPVSRMASRSKLNERTFKRRFKKATGYRPVEYVQTLRIEEAKQMLETTGDTVEDIALSVGYEDSAFFRRLFRRLAGISPSKYRQKFQTIRQLGT
ncbi:GlxA family transcriptional regulator [Emcibacter nanhaiensis]|uniref:Helix-turn-helix domain-containing protein n=1 Tax=Emcibacter nanhaiensis TaxID=1505037 RepID=A0A501PG59_9PROT|nr:helix-turn-helix domain-containing protein [Emcibacter nanhaiensis]TPD59027.1 helix-turn-helix domain-containing protein [Emcibacter nanhaiensis]